MKHTVEVTQRSRGGRTTIATVQVDAFDADGALDLVIASVGLEGVTLKADESYTLKCGDVLTTRFGDEFTGSACATDGSTFVEPLRPGPSLQEEADWLDIQVGELRKKLDDGWSMDTTHAGGRILDVRLNEPDAPEPDFEFHIDSEAYAEGYKKFRDELKEHKAPHAEAVAVHDAWKQHIADGGTLTCEEFGAQYVESKSRPGLAKPAMGWDEIQKAIDAKQIKIPIPPHTYEPKGWDSADSMPIEDVREAARKMWEDGQGLDIRNIPVHDEVYATGGIVKDPAPMFPHIPPPINVPGIDMNRLIQNTRAPGKTNIHLNLEEFNLENLKTYMQGDWS